MLSRVNAFEISEIKEQETAATIKAWPDNVTSHWKWLKPHGQGFGEGQVSQFYHRQVTLRGFPA